MDISWMGFNSLRPGVVVLHIIIASGNGLASVQCQAIGYSSTVREANFEQEGNFVSSKKVLFISLSKRINFIGV